VRNARPFPACTGWKKTSGSWSAADLNCHPGPTCLLSDGKLNDKPKALEILSFGALRERNLAAH
jgi:hypothetical protein